MDQIPESSPVPLKIFRPTAFDGDYQQEFSRY